MRSLGGKATPGAAGGTWAWLEAVAAGFGVSASGGWEGVAALLAGRRLGDFVGLVSLATLKLL
jgi:hypothetical protein